MWKNKLDILIDKKRKYGESVNAGVSNDDLRKFSNILEKNNIKLPNEYINILRCMNGLEFNGMILYGIDRDLYSGNENQIISGFIENNQLWHENDFLKKFAFFGEDDMNWYVYNVDRKYYEALDKPSGWSCVKFNGFYDMLDYMLNQVC